MLSYIICRRRVVFISFHSAYVVSSPLKVYYYTQLIGDARTPPKLLATSSFEGIAVIGESTDIVCFAFHR
jgi:hypothetical protein